MELLPSGPDRRPPRPRSTYQAIARDLGDRLLGLVRQVRVLDAVRWDQSIEDDFLARGGQELPAVSAASYRPLPFDSAARHRDLSALEREVRTALGRGDPIAQLLIRRCRQARVAVDLLMLRGRPAFSRLSADLYGQPSAADDKAINALFAALIRSIPPAADRTIGAAAAVGILAARLERSLAGAGRFRVRLSDNVQSDAAACGRSIKLRRDARFSPADIAALEVHEGWVHLGTTLNARRQPVCGFLAQGPPATTAAQEGLAVLAELLAGVCHPDRLRRLHHRYQAVQMAEDGADFREVYSFFLADVGQPRNAFQQAARVFRGSLPTGVGPFAKDRTYALGLVRLLRTAHAACCANRGDRLQLLFVGKSALADLPLLEALVGAGLIARPTFLPPPFADLTALAARLHQLPHPPHRLSAPTDQEKPLRLPGNRPAGPLSFQEGIGYEWRETG
jgi:uncharacterized protein (TIGR02421 family)